MIEGLFLEQLQKEEVFEKIENIFLRLCVSVIRI